MYPRSARFKYIDEDMDINFRWQSLIKTIEQSPFYRKAVSNISSDYNAIITEQDEIEDVDLGEFEKVLNGR